MHPTSSRSSDSIAARRSSRRTFHARETLFQSSLLGSASAGSDAKASATSASGMPSRLATRRSEMRRSMWRLNRR